jgi:hypothetical protein
MRSEILSIVAVIGLLPCAGRAQEATGAVACPSIQNDQERLACYDRSMRGAQQAPPSSAAPAPSVQSPPPAAVAAPVAVGAAVAASPPAPPNVAPPASATVAQPAPTTVAPAAPPTSAPPPSAPVAAAPTNTGSAAAAAATTAVAGGAAQQASAAGTTSAAAATPPSTVSTAPHNSRSKHPPTDPNAPVVINPVTGAPTGVMPIVVVSTLVRPGFPTEFTTDKVGIWVQAEVKPLTNLPKAPFTAQLEPGKFGGAFLVVPERKLGIRVNGP